MPSLPAQAAVLLSARLGTGAAAPRRSELGLSWDRAAERVSTRHPHPPGPSRGPVSPGQGSNVPQHLSRRAQSPSTLPLLMLGKLRAVLRKRPLKKPNFRDPSPGTRKFRIFVESPLKQTERLPQILFATFVREIEALQIKIVGLRAALFVGGKRNSELDLERVDN